MTTRCVRIWVDIYMASIRITIKQIRDSLCRNPMFYPGHVSPASFQRCATLSITRIDHLLTRDEQFRHLQSKHLISIILHNTLPTLSLFEHCCILVNIRHNLSNLYSCLLSQPYPTRLTSVHKWGFELGYQLTDSNWQTGWDNTSKSFYASHEPWCPLTQPMLFLTILPPTFQAALPQ